MLRFFMNADYMIHLFSLEVKALPTYM